METKQNQVEEIEIDLREVCFFILSKLWIVILVGLLTGGIGFGISNFVLPPTYQSTSKIYILNKQQENTVTYSDVQLGTQLTKDYAQLIKSRLVLEKVIEELELSKIRPGINYEAMSGKVSVTTPADTRILYITVTDTDPVLAMKMANCVREEASVHIKNVMDIEAVNVVETANLPVGKSGPDIKKWTITGGCLGAFFVVAILLVVFFMDDTIKTSDDVEKYLGLSTLALIPMDNQKAGNKGRKKKN